ncbi:MAG: amidohydrolase [Planctomycetota bacterium]|nr:MAG: amidohydrolase [Planctomycetota bacterium]
MSSKVAHLQGLTLVSPHGCRRQDLWLEGEYFRLPSQRSGLKLSLENTWAFPAFVNGHDHLHLNSMAGLPDPPGFTNAVDWAAWLQKEHDRRPSKISTHDPRRFHHGAWKNLLSGATSVAHHDPIPASIDPTHYLIDLIPIKWCHSLAFAGKYGPGLQESRQGLQPRQAWVIHAAEGTDEEAAHEVQQLQQLGFLDSRTVLVHGVGIRENQRSWVQQSGAKLVWCPSSNLKILNRSIDPAPYLQRESLCLGTDSRLSGSQDLISEMKAARELYPLDGASLLKLVTTHPRRIFFLDGHEAFRPESRADFLLIQAGDNPWDALLNLKRNDIAAVVKGGMPALADPTFASWFDYFGIATRLLWLDGKPKLIREDWLQDFPGWEWEPGLSLHHPETVDE